MRLVQPRDELFDSVNRVEALGIGIRDGPAVDHLVLRVEPQLHDLKGHLSLPAVRKEAPYTGGYGASKIQLLTGSDGEEGTPHHNQTNLPRLGNEKVKSIRGTRHLLRVKEAQ
jgi:hypothetical protein